MQFATVQRRVRLTNLRGIFVLGAAMVALAATGTACEKGKKAVKEKQEEVAEKVGGAPKRQINTVTNRVNASIKKGVDRYGENSGVEVK